MPAHDLRSVAGPGEDVRRQATRNPYSPVMILLTLIATGGIIAYAIFLLNPANRGDALPYALVIAAEAVLIGHPLVAMWTILAGSRSARDDAYFTTRRQLFAGDPSPTPQTPIRIGEREASVAVFITTYGEPLEVIRRTATAARDLTGRHQTYLLDDGRSDEVRALAAEVGVGYLRRLSSGGAKAGNIGSSQTRV